MFYDQYNNMAYNFKSQDPEREPLALHVLDLGMKRGNMRIAPQTPSARSCRLHMVVSLFRN